MKKHLTTKIAALMTAATLALVMALTIVPFSALPRSEAKAEAAPTWTVPAGYNEHDYNKIAAFLEQTDENGVKNGEKISETYDPNDPSTWGENYRLQWTSVNGEQRVWQINIYDKDLCGSFDVSGCTALEELRCYSNNLTELDVSQNTALKRLVCSSNPLTELDVSQNTALEDLGCASNNMTELDVSQNTALKELDCRLNNLTELDVTRNTALEGLYCGSNNLTELDVAQNTALGFLSCDFNNLTELDVTRNTALESLDCSGNNLTELDLSNNPKLGYDHIRADGSGFIAYARYAGFHDVLAYPQNGASFDGFYDENGALISAGTWRNSYEAYVYGFEGIPTGTIIARFSDGAAPTPAPSEAPVNPTDAPVNPSDAPVNPSDAPVNPSDAPVNPSDAPVNPTAAPTAAPNPPATGTVALAGVGIAAIIGGIGTAAARRKKD